MTRLFVLLLSTTALSVAGISTTLAAGDVVGTLSLGGIWTSFDGPGVESDVDSDGFRASGQVSGAYNFTPVLGVQGDVVLRYETATFDDEETEGFEQKTTSIDGALHLFYRDPDSFLLGGFVQLGKDSTSYGDDEIDVPDLTRSYGGVEGQAFFDQVTVYGQLGLQKQSYDTDEADDLDGWFVTAEVRYFLTPDFKIAAHVGRSELELDTGESFTFQLETVTVGASAEYKFDTMPVSVFASYDYSTTGFNIQDDVSIDSHRVLVGVKFNMGEETLQDRDRNGASLKPVDFGTNSFLSGFSSPPPP